MRLSKWDKRWVERAKEVSKYSKDKNTQTGAIIIDDDRNEIVMGYNGFPRGADDDNHPKRYERPEKYFWTEHAERNAIYKAARMGMSTKGGTMYCTYFPCADCSRAIIQGGIIKLVTEKPDFNHHKWGESWVEALIMLKECGVEVVWTNEPTHWTVEYLSRIDEWCLTANCENGPISEKYFNSEATLIVWAKANEIKLDENI